jgi:hypothetical protein
VAEVPAALLPEVLGGTCPEAELAPEASLAALQVALERKHMEWQHVFSTFLWSVHFQQIC